MFDIDRIFYCKDLTHNVKITLWIKKWTQWLNLAMKLEHL